jgi:hypothetical protein
MAPNMASSCASVEQPAEIAPDGQWAAQVPQLVQIAGSIQDVYRPSISIISGAHYSQVSMQVLQALQRSGSTTAAIGGRLSVRLIQAITRAATAVPAIWGF